MSCFFTNSKNRKSTEAAILRQRGIGKLGRPNIRKESNGERDKVNLLLRTPASPACMRDFLFFFLLQYEIFSMFRNIHYIYPDNFFLVDGFSLILCKGRFSFTGLWLVVWRVDYNKLTTRVLCVNQTNVLHVIVVSLIYALQCRRVVSLPLARCTLESCAVSIDLDRTF